ncbi:MAG TPA: succinylglutamate desuccinylase/aspartoacylase family protein [Dehalococcoidia bacterium]|nr:succinylglutamate desuccinylase/aspartoacylase family protein [Dehalococcoidia bacterium]
MPETPRLSRRRLLRLTAALPFGALLVACGGDGDAAPAGDAAEAKKQPPAPTSTPEPPFVVAAGEQKRLLLPGTPSETPAYVFGTGLPGKVVMALGGVHGNEPGGWQAAEQLADRFRPVQGAFIIIPRANKLAITDFVRTTDQLGDLNRLYPGAQDGLPMAQMAYSIVDLVREFHVAVLVDMHESWAFYKDRSQNGTAFLGQTVATYPAEPGMTLGRNVVDAVNGRILGAQEEFTYREFPSGRLPNPTSAAPNDTSGNPQAAVSGGSQSSLGLPRYIENLTVLLVEMGQQQLLSRRVALHVDVFQEVARRSGIVSA